MSELTTPRLSDDDLADVHSFESAVALLDRLGVPVESASDYGTGFTVVDKDALVGVDFVILEWAVHDGDFGEFTSVTLVTRNNDKVVINDGSSGVHAQLTAIANDRAKRGHPHPRKGLAVKGGLTKSEYYFDAETGDIRKSPADGYRKAVTYYLAQ